MARERYRCTNPSCEEVTVVTVLPATLRRPEASTWAEGCACGAQLQGTPITRDRAGRVSDEVWDYRNRRKDIYD